MNLNIKSLLSIVILILGLPFWSECQELLFRNYSTNDGLPSNEIHNIYQDSYGYLWIGTAEGVSKYDGHSFTNYSVKDGLGFNYVSGILEDRNTPGTMWFVTSDYSISRLASGAFTRWTLPPEVHSTNSPSIAQDHKGVIWCAGDSGVFLIDPKGGIREFHPEQRFRYARHIHEVGDSLVWIICCFEVWKYYVQTDRLERIELPNIVNRVHEIEQVIFDSLGVVWCADITGAITKILPNGPAIVHQTGVKSPPGFGTFYFICEDGEGNFWLGTQFGLLKVPKDRIKPETITRYTMENGLPENVITSMMVDREKNLWIGCFTKGLVKLSERNTFTFPFHPFKRIMNVQASVTDTHGHIWMPVDGGIIELQFMDDAWKTYLHKKARLEVLGDPFAVTLDSRGQLWIEFTNTHIGCFQIINNPSGGSQIRLLREFSKSRLPENYGLLYFIVDRYGRIWQSIQDVGVHVFDPSREQSLVRTLTAFDGLPQKSIRTMFEDREGNIWFGSFSEGLAMLPAGQWEHGKLRLFTTADGLPENKIRSLNQDDRGRLLVGTRYGGLAIYEDGRFHAITTEDGLISNTIWNITKDRNGKIWLATHLGAQCFDIEQGKPLTIPKEFFGEMVSMCGIFRNEFLWCNTPNQLIIHNYALRKREIPPPPVYISRLVVNGRESFAGTAIEFSHDQNNIVINFIGLSYRDEKSNRYQYRLQGIDKDWQAPTKNNSVTFATLAPGSYKFEVKVINADGIESANPARLAFTIISPYWMRWWFICCVILFIIVITVLIYRLRVNQLLKIERMRTRIATDLHDDIGASLSRIALFSEVAKSEASSVSPRLHEMAGRIGDNARELLDSVGTLVWSIDPRHDRFEDVIIQLKNFAQEMFTLKNIDFTFQISSEASNVKLPLDARKNLLLIFKEAVNNINKHSECTRVGIDLQLIDEVLEMTITDDGKGLDRINGRTGHGITNMITRAKNIGGNLDISSEIGKGTNITLRIPLDRKI